MKDNPTQLDERELPEWLQADHEAQREREAIDRFKIGVATLIIMLASLMVLGAIYTHGGAA